MLRYSSKLCSNPRDRIFALNSVLALDGIIDLQPDYSKQTATLYRSFGSLCLAGPTARWNISHPALLLVLAATESEPLDTGDTVSWVPNLHRLTDASQAKEKMYNALSLGDRSLIGRSYDDVYDDIMYMKSRFSCVIPSDNSLELQVLGQCFATAREPISVPVLPSIPDGENNLDANSYYHFEWFMEWYCRLRRIFAACCLAPPTNLDTALTAFLSYPTQWSTPGVHMIDWTDEIRESFCEQYACTNPDCSLDFNEDLRVRLDWLMIHLPQCPLARKRTVWLIETENRVDMAWFPESVDRGDRICFMLTPWPSVIRHNGDDTFKLIGDGHVFATPLIEAVGGQYDEMQHGVPFYQGEPLGLNMPELSLDELSENLQWIKLR